MLTATLPTAAAWLVTLALVEAAIIDGKSLRVPNWLTFHLAAGGLAYWAWVGGWGALGWSSAGLAVGLAALLPLCVIGGMGAGDAKLFAGVGAWIGPLAALHAFAASGIVGGIIAVAMIARSGQAGRHVRQMRAIAGEVLAVRDPDELSRRAAERKPAMTLLPFGIPLAIGSIGYFAWTGMLS